MMISTKGRYALRVMIDLARNDADEFVSLKGISERQHISMKYLEAIVAVLNKSGFLQSLRGKDGGYKLSKMPCEYTIGSILKLCEGSLAPVACLEGGCDTVCQSADGCITLPLWQKLDGIIDGYLESITLEDLLKGTV